MSRRTHVGVSEEPNLQQLREELAAGLGLERGPVVTYHPDVSEVEVASEDTRVPGIVAGHAPDRRRRLPPHRRELLELIEEHERGELAEEQRERMNDLVLTFVKEQLGGG